MFYNSNALLKEAAMLNKKYSTLHSDQLVTNKIFTKYRRWVTSFVLELNNKLNGFDLSNIILFFSYINTLTQFKKYNNFNILELNLLKS